MEDRDRSGDWTKPVGIPDEHIGKVRRNVTQGCFYREVGRFKSNVPPEFLWAAEDKLVDKSTYEELKCQLPDSPRSTFLMVFSPDGKKVASTHGNHNVYVTDLTTGKNIQTLSGHPRTPWCIAFHPSSNQILASGCLAGQVRVWDLHGGSELWTVDSHSVIASLAFHPVDRMLVIATYNELHFWDWSQSKPFAKCSTKSEREKVRYVSFDRLGNKLITGIANPVSTPSQWDRVSVVNTQPMMTTMSTTVPITTMTTTTSSVNQGRSLPYSENYVMNQIFRRYLESRSSITRTIDRGTDPMDLVDVQNLGSQSEGPRPGSSTSQGNSNRSVRYRIMRSTCRSYRPPSSRECFRIHSSLLSGLPSWSSSTSNSLVRTTTTTTTTSQSIIFTTIATTTTTSTSQLSRLRQCGFSLVSGRLVCITSPRENSSSLFSPRTSQPSQPQQQNQSVTSPIDSSHGEEVVFSMRDWRRTRSATTTTTTTTTTTATATTTTASTSQLSEGPSTLRTRTTETGRSGAATQADSILFPLRDIMERCRSRVSSGSAGQSAGNTSSTWDTLATSGAVTDTTDSTHSEGAAFRPREPNASESERSRVPLIRPYRFVFDDANHVRASVHTLVRPTSNEEGTREQRANAISPLDRRDRLRSFFLDVEEVDVDRDLQRSFTYVSPFRRLSSDSESTSTTPTNTQRPSPQQWVSHNANHFPLHPRPVPRFQVRPNFELNNSSPVRRSREDTDSESSSNTTPSVEASSSDPATSHSMSPVPLNAGPVPRIQIRPRYLQDQQSQLQLITNPESQGTSSQSSQNLRRQFVLSRHSNSPFQPRVPHRIDITPSSSTPPTTTAGPSSSRPEIPSCMSSFVASGASSTTRTTPSVSLPVGNVASSTSKATNTATTTIAGDDSFVRGTRELRNRLHFFDHVKLLLRDRIMNSSENASTDSTVNYSNIANESEGESRNMMDNSLEEGASSSGLGPRGLDPMLSSVSENADPGNDPPLFPTSSAAPAANGESSSDDALSDSNVHFIFPSWESDMETFPSSPAMDPLESDTETVPFQSSPVSREERPQQRREGRSPTADEARRTDGTNPPPQTLPDASSSELSVRQKIQILSLHIENMQRLCRARIEIVQLQQIRKMWEDLTTQIRSLHTAVQSNWNAMQQLDESSDASNSSRDPVNPSVNHLMRLAISDTSPVPETSATTTQPQTQSQASPSSSTAETSDTNFYSHFHDVVESMVNALLDDDKQSKDSQGRKTESTPGQEESVRNESEEPQPGPSGLSGNRSNSGGGGIPSRDYFKSRIYKSLRDILNRTKRRRDMGLPARHTRFRLGDTSRSRFRRQGRHSVDSSTPRISSRDFCSSSIESLINSLETTASVYERSADAPGPSSTTTSEGTATGGDSMRACQSCGHKKKAPKESQKRRSTDEPPGAETSSKVMKNNVGGRSVASTSDAAAAGPSLSASSSQQTAPDANSTSELLRQMIERMETMVRFQREAFRRTEELTGPRGRRSETSPSRMNSSDDSDSDAGGTDVHRSLYMRNVPGREDSVNMVTRKDVVNLRRAVTQLRARRLLDYMVKSLTEFFEENSDNSASVLDDQIISLYTLLHLALELTDLLLEQLNATSHDLEGAWNADNPTASSNETRDPDWLFSDRSRVIRRLRERSRGLTRSSIHPSFGPNREESRRVFPNPFLRSFTRTSRQHTSPRNSTGSGSGLSGSGGSSGSVFCRYRPSTTLFPAYRRSRRAPPRMPSWWCSLEEPPRRVVRSRETTPSSVILPSRISNGEGNNQLRGLRFWGNRRSAGEDESDPNRRSDSNNNNNGGGGSGSGSGNGSGSAPAANSDSNNNEGSGQNPLPFSTYLREHRPLFWIRYGSNNSEGSPSSTNDAPPRESSFTVPVVHVNDVPVQDISMLNQPRYRPQSPTPRAPEDIWRWRAWRPRFLYPRSVGPYQFDDQDSSDVPEGFQYYRTIPNPGVYIDPVIITDAPMSPHHRIQAWDFSKMNIPDISDREANGVVAECKIHNDASVDVSNDGHLLVTLLPSGRFSITTMLGVYSLDWNSLGQLLYKTSFEQNAVSVSLSPTNRHLLVGLASRPLVVRDRTNMAQIFRLEGARPTPPGGTWQSGRGRLVHMRDLEQTREANAISLNCIRWAPVAGQGLVYGTNTGQLKVLR